jgi:hypothetical protein
MKTECFAHVHALPSNISRAHQEFGFLASPKLPPSSAEIDAEKSNFFE